MFWAVEETGFEVLIVQVVGSEVWPVGVTEHWNVLQFGPWLTVVTEPEVGAVVATVPEV